MGIRTSFGPRLGRALRAGVPVVAALVLGCEDLPSVRSGVCGNHVVDPDEDCDTYPIEEGTRCVPPGEPASARRPWRSSPPTRSS